MIKEKKSTAIKYSLGDNAPRVIASARGFLAERLIRTAIENNITVYKDANLAEILSLMNPGNEIPEDLYFIISEVLAYCYNVNNKFREKIDIH